MGRNLIETVMGAVVLLVAGAFVFFASEMAQMQKIQGYPVEATFYKVGGLATGSDVRINGIKVGTVTGRRLDSKTFDAVLTLSISSGIELPTDTVAGIGSEGFAR